MASEKKKKNIFKLIVINILIFIVGFVVIDLILGKYRIPHNFNLFRTKHPYYHHGMLPDKSQYTAWGRHLYKINTNSLGFMDTAQIKVPLKSDEHRILIIGDSHSEGVGVEFKNTFCGILEKKTQDMPIEFLNASAVSYSPKIHFLKVDYLLNKKHLEVDEVWTFIDLSDLQNEIAYENFIPKESNFFTDLGLKLKYFLKKRSFTYYAINSSQESKKINAFISKMSQFDPRNVQNLEKNTVELYEDFFRDFKDDDLLRSPEFHGVGKWYYNESTMDLAKKGLALGTKNIERLDSLCDSKDIKLKLFVHPWHAQIYEQDTTDFYVETWKNFCKEKGIDFVNLFPLFINGENPVISIDKYYIPGDNHWNEAGHEKVGEFLFNELIKNK